MIFVKHTGHFKNLHFRNDHHHYYESISTYSLLGLHQLESLKVGQLSPLQNTNTVTDN